VKGCEEKGDDASNCLYDRRHSTNIETQKARENRERRYVEGRIFLDNHQQGTEGSVEKGAARAYVNVSLLERCTK
jgi:hypothetical protein